MCLVSVSRQRVKKLVEPWRRLYLSDLPGPAPRSSLPPSLDSLPVPKVSFQEEIVDLKIERKSKSIVWRKEEGNVTIWASFDNVREHDRLLPKVRAAPGQGRR